MLAGHKQNTGLLRNRGTIASRQRLRDWSWLGDGRRQWTCGLGFAGHLYRGGSAPGGARAWSIVLPAPGARGRRSLKSTSAQAKLSREPKHGGARSKGVLDGAIRWKPKPPAPNPVAVLPPCLPRSGEKSRARAADGHPAAAAAAQADCGVPGASLGQAVPAKNHLNSFKSTPSPKAS